MICKECGNHTMPVWKTDAELPYQWEEGWFCEHCPCTRLYETEIISYLVKELARLTVKVDKLESRMSFLIFSNL